jgi:hypothetical protein
MLSSPMTGHMSKFALLCQAARLLGQVLQHVSNDSAIHDNVWIQLDHPSVNDCPFAKRELTRL